MASNARDSIPANNPEISGIVLAALVGEWRTRLPMLGEYPVRQVEEYDSGIRLRYGPDHREDDCGGLGFTHVSEWDPPTDQGLSAVEFETVRAAGPWHNI